MCLDYVFVITVLQVLPSKKRVTFVAELIVDGAFTRGYYAAVLWASPALLVVCWWGV